MVATIPKPVTVEEFLQLPGEEGEVYSELHHGEVVRYFRPKHKHVLAQSNIQMSFFQVAGNRGVVLTGFWFQGLPEYDLRAADVVYISRERWDSLDPEDMFRGVPEIVIEVLSPSNTALDMLDKEQLCLENGAKEFWLVDLVRK